MSAMLAGSIIELLHRYGAAFVLSKMAEVQVSRAQTGILRPQRPGRSRSSRVVHDDGDGLIFLFRLRESNAGTKDGQGFKIALAKRNAREATGARRNFQATDLAKIIRAATELSEFLCSAMLTFSQAGIRLDAAAVGSGTP